MPVHSPGPRLYNSIPFHHLAQVKGHGGKAVNVALNVTPFVDMMTILVTFLLMVFSSSGELIAAQRGLQLPDATNQEALKLAPIIIVTQDAITFDGHSMGNPNDIMDGTSTDMKIPELFQRLKEQRRVAAEQYAKMPKKEKEYCEKPVANPKPEEICLTGLLVLQADRDTPAKVLNRVIKTANMAEFPNVMFVVNIKTTGPS